MFMIDGIKLTFFNQSHKVGKFKSNNTGILQGNFYSFHKIIDIRT